MNAVLNFSGSISHEFININNNNNNNINNINVAGSVASASTKHEVAGWILVTFIFGDFSKCVKSTTWSTEPREDNSSLVD